MKTPIRVLCLVAILAIALAPAVWAQGRHVGAGGVPGATDDLAARVSELEATVEALLERNADQASRIDALENQLLNLGDDVDGLALRVGNLEAVDVLDPAIVAAFSVDAAGENIYLTGVNLHIRNGAGHTDSVNGLGNLIIGYDEYGLPTGFGAGGEGTPDEKTGSHNVVVGIWHSYTSFAGLVVGEDNAITGRSASVSGGFGHMASGRWSSVSGGLRNNATNDWASVSGGFARTADGVSDWRAGGLFQTQ